MLTHSKITMGRRLSSFLSNLLLLAFLLLTTGIAHSAVSWVTQTSTSNNDFLSMSSDGGVIAFTTSSTVYGGSGSGNAVVKLRTGGNPAAVPGFTFFGTVYPWLTPNGSFVGFFGYPDTTFDAGVYKIVPGTATVTSVDLNKNTSIAAVLNDAGNLVAYLANPDNVYNRTGSGTVFYGTTNLGSSTSKIAASADGSKIAYRHGNTIYYYGGSGGASTLVVSNAGGSFHQGPALSADGTRIAFPALSSQISVRATSALGTAIYTLAGEAPVALSSDGTILTCKKAAANAMLIYKNGVNIGEITTSGNATPLEMTVATTGKYIGYVATNTLKHVYQWANELPTLNNITNPAAIEMDTAALQTVNLAGITSGDTTNETQTLSVSAAVTGGTNTNLIKNLAVTYTSANATGTITYNANDHQAGNAIVTVTVGDSIDTITKTFTITINPNHEPTIDVIPDPAAILEDAGQQTVNLSGITSGHAIEVQALTVTATSSNTALIPDPLVTYTSAQTTGTLKYTPVANIFGSAVISVKVKDNGGTAFGGDDEIIRTFTVNVTPVNDVPSFTKGGDITVLEDSGAYSAAWATGISSGPADESAQLLDFIVSNDNNALFSVQPAVSATGVLSFTTAANANGSATVTVKIHDNGGTANGGVNTSAEQTFSITVTAVNDVPSFTEGDDVTVLEDSGAYSATWATDISAGPVDESAQAVEFIVTNNRNSQFSVQPAVSPTGVLTFTTAGNLNGTATVTIQIKDNGGVANGGVDTSEAQTFTITITPVNDVPYFSKGPNVTMLEDSAAYSAAWATNINRGAGNEGSQVLDFIVTNDNNGLFSVQPAVSPTGVLTFTPAADAYGSTIVSVKLHDDGGTENGGVDTSAIQTITITFTAVNDVPSFTKGDNVTVLEDSGSYSNAWATDISAGPANESAQAVNFIVSNTNDIYFTTQPAISASGVLSFTVKANVFGTSVVTVKIQDDGGVANAGVDTSATQTFNIIITPVNDAPSFTKGANVTVLEDAASYDEPWATAILKGPANEGSQVVDFIVTNDNNGLFSVQPAVSAAGALSFTVAGDANGSATVTVKIHDNGGTDNGGVDTSAEQTFLITVTAVNDAPSFTKGDDVTVLEDSGAYSAAWATGMSAGPADEVSQVVDFTVTNTNNGLFSVQPAVSTTGVLSFTLAANANGAATVSVNINDDGGTANGGVAASAIQTFTITVTAVNDIPTLDSIANPAAILEDAAQQTVNLAGITSGNANEDQTLTVTATSSNTALIPDPLVTYTSAQTTGTLKYTPIANMFGSSVITVKVKDNGGTASGGVDEVTRTFTVTVTSVNDVPSFTKGNDITVLEDSGAYSAAWASSISSGPVNESTQTIDFIVTNNNNDLFSVQPAVSATGLLTFTPAATANGEATVTVKIHDNGGTDNGGVDTSAEQTFTITVTAVNDVPSFTKGSSLTVLEDSAAYSAAWATGISSGPANESGQIVDFIVTNNNNDLFSVQPAVSATGVLTFTPAANANGHATVTVQIHDNGGIANGGDDTSGNQYITIALTAVNDVPSFTKGDNVIVLEDSGAYSAAWATGISSGPANESGQPVDFIVTNNNNDLFSVQPAVSATGVLTFTPAANANGHATVTVKIHDDGGTANGGVDTSGNQIITIAITAVNDVPSFTKGDNVTVLEDSGAYSAAWATSISAGPANESEQAVDFIVSNDNNALFSTQPAVSATGELTFTPAANAHGSATVTVKIHDDGGTTSGGVDTSAEQTFTITVTELNDAPSYTAGDNVTVLEDSGAYSATWATDISAGPADESGQTVEFIVTNNRNSQFSVQPAVSPTGVLTFTTAGNMNGTATVTIQIKDNGGVANGGVDTSEAQTFTITITAVNDVPYFTKGADVTVAEDSAAYSAAWATTINKGAGNEGSQAVDFIVTNDNNGLFSVQPAVSPTGVLTFTPAANTSGSATVSVQIHDDGGIENGGVDTSAIQTFVITVNAVNEAPSFIVGDDVTVLEDSGAYSAASATSISAGPANESTQTVDFIVSNDNNALFNVQPALSPTGVLTFTPEADAHGVATVSVQLHDDGGVLYGGVDTSEVQTFTITVTSVNDIPTLDSIDDPERLIGGNSPEQSVAISGISAGAANESSQILTITATSSNTDMIPTIAVDYTQGDSTATLRFTPVTGVGGTSVITVTVTDDGGTANGGQNTVSETFSQAIDIRLFSVALSFDKDTPQLEGTEIAITAIPNGGTNNTYFFTAAHSLTPSVMVPLGTGDYDSSPTVNWTPAESGRYTIRGYAKDSIQQNIVSKIFTYLVYRESLLPDAIVTLSTSRPTPQPLSVDPITLTATLSAGSTGVGLKYKFSVTDRIAGGVVYLGTGLDGDNYQDSSTVDWTPADVGSYSLRVDVKDPTNSIIKSRIVYYTINSSALLPTTTVSLTTSRDTPQLVSVDPITLTASLSSGTGVGVLYKFTATNGLTGVVDTLGSGLDANGYQLSPTVDWTPVAGSYTLRLTALDPSTNILKYAPSSRYIICTDAMLPGATVALTTNKATPQLVSVDPITLTATISAGSTGVGLKYKFTVYNIFAGGTVTLGTGLDADGYQDSNVMDWTPVDSGLYRIYVYAKDPTNNYTVNKNLSYTICSDALVPGDIVTLAANPASPQLLSVGPITLTASLQTGTGVGLRYRFTAINITTGVTEVLGSDLDAGGYQLSNTVTWTPTSVTRYSLRVYVKDVSNNYLRSSSSQNYYIN